MSSKRKNECRRSRRKKTTQEIILNCDTMIFPHLIMFHLYQLCLWSLSCRSLVYLQQLTSCKRVSIPPRNVVIHQLDYNFFFFFFLYHNDAPAFSKARYVRFLSQRRAFRSVKKISSVDRETLLFAVFLSYTSESLGKDVSFPTLLCRRFQECQIAFVKSIFRTFQERQPAAACVQPVFDLEGFFFFVGVECSCQVNRGVGGVPTDDTVGLHTSVLQQKSVGSSLARR